MAEIRVLSAGAAQAVVEAIAADYRRDTGHSVSGEFGAVGAIRQKILDGARADVIVLTAAMIDELVASGHVAGGTRADLGRVGTGVAVRAGAPVADVSTAQKLRDRLLAAARVVCPDPAIATAGKVVLQVLDRLEAAGAVRPRLQYFPNGYAAMKWLAESGAPGDLGITQITEILANPGVKLAGPLPGDLQVRTVYAAGLAAGSSEGADAHRFLQRLASSRAVLARAGYEFET
jgi:molybdate transport system substrate-binding protein